MRGVRFTEVVIGVTCAVGLPFDEGDDGECNRRSCSGDNVDNAQVKVRLHDIIALMFSL